MKTETEIFSPIVLYILGHIMLVVLFEFSFVGSFCSDLENILTI